MPKTGAYGGETHWQNGAGSACDHVDADAKVTPAKIVLSWKGASAGSVTLTPTDPGWWVGRLKTGEPCEFEAFERDDVVVLWGKWGDVGKALDRAWYVRLEWLPPDEDDTTNRTD